MLAERVGFKPTERLGRSPDFESGPFDHSGIFPCAKVLHFFDFLKIQLTFVYTYAIDFWNIRNIMEQEYKNIEKRIGVAIPVFALRSQRGFGIGEFTDLQLLADWCAATGQNIIQILPINDTQWSYTWQDSYPYNAVSSFALNPIYIDLEALGMDSYAEYHELRRELNALPQIDYERVIRSKYHFLEIYYNAYGNEILKNQDYIDFVKANSYWLPAYADYCVNRDTAIWKELLMGQRCAPGKDFYYVVQYILDKQLRSAVNYIHSKGIFLKGDLPIGVNRDSVDVLQFPNLFNMDFCTGAPPDVFSDDGQNWGFPTYNWETMEADGFTWWKERLRKMSCYFDAFRIDHLLGFFRIWEIPLKAESGLLGHFSPALPYKPDDMMDLYGFEFKKEFLSPANNNGKEVLFVADPRRKGYYHPRINGYNTIYYAGLSEEQKEAFNDLYHDFFYRRQNAFWRTSAMKKLPQLLAATNMVVCGEDLGMIPACVPQVMNKLGIMSLEIFRMPKHTDCEFDDPKRNPEMSVCTTSSHDMSPLRAWWEEDRNGVSRRYFYDYLHWEGNVPYFAEDWLIRGIIEDHLKSPSLYKIFPIQDLLALSPALRRTNPAEERINIPMNPRHYWRYRLHLNLEQLVDECAFNSELRNLFQTA